VVDHPATEMPEWTRGSTVDLTFRLRTADRGPCICSHHATLSLNNPDGSFCSIAIFKNRFRRQLALSRSLGQSYKSLGTKTPLLFAHPTKFSSGTDDFSNI
jgi:hypothetical protein